MCLGFFTSSSKLIVFYSHISTGSREVKNILALSAVPSKELFSIISTQGSKPYLFAFFIYYAACDIAQQRKQNTARKCFHMLMFSIRTVDFKKVRENMTNNPSKSQGK